MSNNEERFTLEEITASWLGHGKQIPIGKSMAWLIKRVEKLEKTEKALRQLRNESAGLTQRKFFEREIRNAIGNTNFECLRQRVNEASAVLKEISQDVMAENDDWHEQWHLENPNGECRFCDPK